MAAIQILVFTILLIFPLSTLSQITNSPSPAPGPSVADSSPPPAAISNPPANAPSPDSAQSPPAPPPSDLAPSSAPTPGDDEGFSPPMPPPVPSVVVDLDTGDDNSPNGMTAGKKAGIAVGVIAAVAVVGIGAIVYKKRQQNIRRTQYGEAARRDFL